jgi:uncharacterized protein YuzE
MKFSYDPEVDAASLRLLPGQHSANSIVVEDDALWKPIVIDIDLEGHIVGFEFLEASASLPAKLLDEFRP